MSFDPSNVEKAYSYQQYLEENIELKKIISKLENFLSKERSEKISLQKIHEDFKLIHDKTRKELSDLNMKLTQHYNERLTQERKFEQELQRQKTFFDKQKEAYEQQLLKLSAYDEENFKNKIIFDCEESFKERLYSKDKEIESLNETLNENTKKHELLITEYETMKNEFQKEIDLLKDSHKNEVRELLFKLQLVSEKSESSIDKEAFREIKNENDLIRKQNNEFMAEISALRREKELSVMEKNDTRLSLIKELDAERLKNKILEADNDRYNHVIKNLEYEVTYIKNKLDEKNEELKQLIEEKFSYAKQLKEKDLNFEQFKAEIKVLRQKMDERDKEINDTLYINSEKEKQQYLQEKEDKESLMKQIESLSFELKENQIEFKNFYEKANDEIHSYKRDFYIVSEEKKTLTEKVNELQQELEYIREDYDKKNNSNGYLEKELMSLQEKYRDLSQKEAKNSALLLKLSNEDSDSKIKDLIYKKEYYKNKVRNIFLYIFCLITFNILLLSY